MKATNLHIGAKCVGKDDLKSLIETLHNGQHFSCIIAATWKEIWFEDFESFWQGKKDVLNESQWGRAFGENAEVRWREDEEGNGFLCRWIFEEVSPPDVEGAQQYPKENLEQLEPQDQTFLLWGMPLAEVKDKNWKWVKDSNNRRVWYVTRIPRPLTYPIDNELAGLWEQGKVERRCPLCLRVRFYLRQGRPMFDRFVKLEAHQGFRQGGKVDAG
ncbi:type III-D CRISPR-associated protein Csx19 [Thermocrinis sp.]